MAPSTDYKVGRLLPSGRSRTDTSLEDGVTARAVSLTIVAFLLGALAAGGIGVRVIREVKTAANATSLPPSNIAPEALTLFPVEIPFTVGEASAVVDVGLGITVELLDVSEDGSATIVQLAVEIDDPARTSLFVIGAGPGWLPGSYDSQDGRTVNLTWVDGPLPDEIPLRASGGVWISIDDGSAGSSGGTS